MVMLYVGGHMIGRLTQDGDVLARLVAAGERVELRDETGKRVARVMPENEPLVPWDPTITQADLDRIASEPGVPFEEVKKRLGWE
jgi:hypothetical protein